MREYHYLIVQEWVAEKFQTFIILSGIYIIILLGYNI